MNHANFTTHMNQFMGVLRIEMRKQLWAKQALTAYGFCSMVLLVALLNVAFTAEMNLEQYMAEIRPFLAQLYFWFLIKGAVFFGCLTIFLNLFRGELLDRSLHYYFLTPLRREGLVFGKFVAGVLSSMTIFGVTTLLTVVIGYSYAIKIGGWNYLVENGDISAAFIYTGLTILACVGYGATFLLFGFFIRNSIVPSVIFFAWEWVSFLLPPIMQRFTVIHYVRSLLPFPIRMGPVAVVTDPTPYIWSIPGMALFALLALVLVCTRIRWMDIRYT